MRSTAAVGYFFNGPTFVPYGLPIPLGSAGQVLTMVGGIPVFAAGASGIPALGDSIAYAPAAGQSNDVNPAGFDSGVGAILVTLSANSNWTGLAAGTEGQTIRITVVAGAFTLTLNNLNAGSAAANRFQGAGDFAITLNSSLLLQYRAALNGGNGAWSMA